MWPRRKTQRIEKPPFISRGYERLKAMRAAASLHPEAPTVDDRVQDLERKVRTLTQMCEKCERDKGEAPTTHSRHEDAPGTE